MDNITVAIPPAHTLEFVLQHRFGSIQGGWSDLAGICRRLKHPPWPELQHNEKPTS